MDQDTSQWPRATGGGTMDTLNCAAAFMLHMGNVLLNSGQKIRVTIECDPETGSFTTKREIISQK